MLFKITMTVRRSENYRVLAESPEDAIRCVRNGECDPISHFYSKAEWECQKLTTVLAEEEENFEEIEFHCAQGVSQNDLRRPGDVRLRDTVHR